MHILSNVIDGLFSDKILPRHLIMAHRNTAEFISKQLQMGRGDAVLNFDWLSLALLLASGR